MRAKDFLKDDVVRFRPRDERDDRTDQEKYDDALSGQMSKHSGYDPLDPNQKHRPDLGRVPCPYCDDVWCDFNCDEAQADGFEEGDVVHSKFQQGLAHKRGMFYSPDAEPPVSKKNGQPFDRFEVSEHPRGKIGTIIGVQADGYTEEVGTSQLKVAQALASAYNAGGYSKEKIERVPVGDYFK